MNELEEKIDRICNRILTVSDLPIVYQVLEESKIEILSLIKEEIDKSKLNTPVSINPFCVEVKDRHKINEWITEWRELFPSNIRKNGKSVRSDDVSCTNKMKTFFNKYTKFNKEDVFLATKQYIQDNRKESYQYLQLAHYFIFKDNISALGAICEENRSKGIKEIKEEKTNNGLGSTEEI